jgi:calcineurin-like phosphoesterase family protein
MNEVLLYNWNKVVKPDDTVYIVGDLALCPFKEFESLGQQLNGIKYLIKGNHDSYSNGQYARIGITVFHEVKMKLAGNIVRLSHYPYALPWYRRPFAYKSELRNMDKRPPRIPGEFLIHGHTHTKYKRAGNRLHVGTDAWNYSPVAAYSLESLMSKP